MTIDHQPLTRELMTQLLVGGELPRSADPASNYQVDAVCAASLLALDSLLSRPAISRLQRSDVKELGGGAIQVLDHVFGCDHRERQRGVPWDCTACSVRTVLNAHDGQSVHLFHSDSTRREVSRWLITRARAWPALTEPDLSRRSLQAAFVVLPGTGEWELAGLRRGLVVNARQPNSVSWVRGRAWVSMSFEAGLRMCSDLVRLPRSAIAHTADGNGWRLGLGPTKDDPLAQKRSVRVFRFRDDGGPSAAQALSEYLCVRDAAVGAEGPLLLGARGGLLAPKGPLIKPVQAASFDLDLLCELADLPQHFTSYSTRKGFARQTAKDGWELEETQEGLRHSKPETTLGYIGDQGAKRVGEKVYPGRAKGSAMSRASEREALQRDLVESANAFNAGYWATYARWCAANDQPPTPTPHPDAPSAKRVLLRFLHANVEARGWAHGYAKAIAGTVARVHQRDGHDDPRSALVRRYLKSLRRVGAQPQRPVDGFTAEQLLHISDPAVLRARNHLSPSALALGGLLAVAETVGCDPTDWRLDGLSRGAFNVRSDDVVIAFEGRRHVLSSARQPDFHAALTEALAATGPADEPFAVTSEAAALRQLLKRSWIRAHPGPAHGGGRLPTLRSIRDWWERSSFNDRQWLLLNTVEPHLARNVQDLAILFVGVVTGHRHVELSRLTIGHVGVTATGYCWTLAPSQHKGGLLVAQSGGLAEPLIRTVDHLDGCPTFCPACILGAHLRVRRRLGALAQDALFGGAGPLGVRGTSAAVQRMWSLVSAEMPGKESDLLRISSRSLRVTAATLARKQGMSIPDISSSITGHKQFSTTARYIRGVAGGDQEDLVLSLEGPRYK